MTLLLNKPHGYNTGIGIKLKFDRDKFNMVNFKDFSILLLGFSCFPYAIPKIYNSLKYSGEYTCFLQGTWFKRQSYHFELLLKEYNIDMEIFFYMNSSEMNEVKNKYDLEKEKMCCAYKDDIMKEIKENNIKQGNKFFNDLTLRGIKIECV